MEKKKRNISIRKVLRAFVTLVVTAGCAVAVLGASQRQQSQTLRKIKLHVRNENKYQFLDKEQLMDDLIRHRAIREGKTRMDSLDLKAIEKGAYGNHWVSRAEVFVDNRRNLHINVTQRVPVARVFLNNGRSYYLDASLKLLPLSELFTYYTTIVTNVPILDNDSLNRDLRTQIVKMVRFIERDTFWSAQIAQITVTPELTFELTPVLGTHKIIFGDITMMEDKFRHLFAFYTHVLNRIGWEKYQVLDLRFAGQVVASPSLPWKPPTKNAVSNMDWLKSIMGEEPAEPARKPTVTASAAVPAKATVTPAAEPKPKAQAPAEKKPEPKKPAAEPRPLKPAAPVEKKPEKPKAAPAQNTNKPDGKYIYQGTGNQ